MKKHIFSALGLLVLLLTAVVLLNACGNAVQFKLNFIVNGEVYATINTAGKEAITLPQNPTKEGETFDGWYWDNGTWQRPFTANSLLDAPLSSDMSVYAKFVPVTYTIIYNANGGTHENPSTYTVKDSVSLSDAVKDGYIFDGWFNGEEKVSEIPEGCVSDLTLTAKWTPIEYTAKFYADGVLISSETFTLEMPFDAPEVPEKVGYIGEWDNLSILPQNLTIHAVYTEKNYEISYQNAKSANNINPVKYTINTEDISLAPLENVNGYTFRGWKDENGSPIEKIETNELRDRTITAEWDLTTYTVSYQNTNGQANSNPDLYTIEDNTITLSRLSNIEGYRFNGWKDETGKIVTQIAKGSYGNKTLTADWKINTYTITWKNYDGSVLKIDTVNFGSMPSYSGTTPVRANDSLYQYAFCGWSPEVVSATDDVTYIAQFTQSPCETFTVRYDAMGGTGAPSAQTKTSGQTLTLSNTVPTKSGHTFMGWNCVYDGNTYQKSSSFSADANVTLYAIWGHDCETCMGTKKIDCNTCGGDGETQVLACTLCGEGPVKVLNDGTGALGFYYKCMNCGAENGVYFKKQQCPDCRGSGKVTCNTCSGSGAKPDTFATYNVSLLNGNSMVATTKVFYENPYKLTVPTKNGYTFLGWFDSQVGGVAYTDQFGVCLQVWNLSQSKTLYAHWKLNVYNIQYDHDDFVNVDALPITYTVEDVSIILPQPTREHYQFVWQLDGKTVTSIDASLAKDLVVKAVWTPIVYSITYALDGGNATNPNSHTVETDTFMLVNPTKNGYMFLGWTGSNGETPELSVTIPTGTSGNLTYYANWQINQYTISFNSNGGSSVDSITQDYATVVAAPDAPAWAERSFVGWFDSTLSTPYTFTTMPAENITLYAKWIEYAVTIACDETTAISVNDGITDPATYRATATDTDGNPVTVSVTVIGGSQAAGNTVTVRLVAMGKYGVYDTKTISNIKVYGIPALNYNTEKDFFNLSDTLSANLFGATATDSFGASLAVSVSVRESVYQAGDTVNVILSATDITGNEIKAEVKNVKVYGKPVITRNNDKNDMKTTDVIGNDLFGVFATDSFGVSLTVTTELQSGMVAGGNTVTVRSSVTDSKGNTSEITYAVKVYASPSIGDATKTSFKVEDEINLATLGVVATDSFGAELTPALELVSGTQTAGATLTYLVTATDHLGNVQTRTFNNIKIYGTPAITYQTSKISMNVTDPISAALLSATAKDSHNGNLEVSVRLESGTVAGGNTVTLRLTATDALGNTCSVVTGEIKVYSAESITLNYNGAASTRIKKTSKGEEFGATAADGFGAPCEISVAVADGYTLAGGNTVNLYLVATDAMGNTAKSELITGIRVYDTPVLTYIKEDAYLRNGYILSNETPYSVFLLLDSFGAEVFYNVEKVSGSFEVGGIVQYRITGTDRTGNEFAEIREMAVIDPGATYTVTYDPNGGTAVENPKTYKITDDVSLSGLADHDYYHFVGWYTADGEKIDNLKGNYGNLTLIAKWESYFTVNNGTIGFTDYAKTLNLNTTLITLGIPAEINGAAVTAIDGNTFRNFTALRTIIIPDSVTSIGSSAFEGCPIEIATIPAIACGYIRSNKLKTVVITSGTSVGSGAFEGCSRLTSITIPNSVTSIGNSAFSGCSGLTSITIPDSVTSIGENAFSGCSGLTSITIPFMGAKAGVTASDTYQYPFGYLFGTSSYTGGTATVQVYHGSNTSSATYTTYYIPSSLKSVTVTGGKILFGAFSSCDGLTSVTIGNGVTNIGERAFSGCTGLTSITIGNSVKSIGSNAFYGCTGLTSVTIPNSVTSIGSYAFYGCTGLTSITIGNSVKSISSYAFRNCTGLTSITIGNSVKSIGSYAFYGCRDLTSITIPDSVTSIGSFAFSGCTGLTDITFTGTKAQWNAISKGSDWISGIGKHTIHCTDGDIAI